MTKIIEALLSVDSESESVLSLTDDLPGIVHHRFAIGESIPFANKEATSNSVAIKLPLSTDRVAFALNDAENWMQKHRETIAGSGGHITLTFTTFIDSAFISQSIKIPASIVRICAEININLVFQAVLKE